MTSKEVNKIIKKFLEGKATPEEIKILEALDTHAEKKINKSIFLNNKEKESTNKELYRNISQRLNFNSSKKKRFNYKPIAIAASITLLVTIFGSYFITNNSKEIKIANTSSSAFKTINLSDGSTVILNQNSTLTYNTTFNNDYRKVALKGEGYFKVSKNKQKPFIVTTNQLSTQVVGTEFNVKSDNTTIQVTVTEGLVKVYHKKDTVHISPNQQAIYKIDTKELTNKNVNALLHNLWSKNTIELNNISLKELALVFNTLYNIKIVFEDNRIIQKRMSITFDKNEPIEKIITRINLINEVNLTKTDNSMIKATL